jgi:sugar O-acyltransferase (sialic acid O-acetyltransferase NeuD family)
MKIGIIGFGDLGKQFYQFFLQDSLYSKAEYHIFDDAQHSNKMQCHSFNDFKKEVFSDLIFFIGLGYKQLTLKKQILVWLNNNERQIGTYIHPSAIIDDTTVLESGVFIYPGCIIDQRVRVMQGTVLNNGVVISHDTQVGVASFFAPGVTICGSVNCMDSVFIGANTVVCNCVSIGENVVIGIGSVITKNIPAHSFVIGNPMQIKKNITI